MNPIITDVIQQNQYLTIGFVVLASIFFIIKYISLASDAANNLSLRKINKLKAIQLSELPQSKLQNFITKAYDEEVFNLLTNLNANRKTINLLVTLYESDLLTMRQLKLVGRFIKEKDEKLLIQYDSFEKFQASYSLMLFLLTGFLFFYLLFKSYFITNIFTFLMIAPIHGLAFYFLGELVIKDFKRYKALHEIYPELKAENIIHPQSDSIEVKFITLMKKDMSLKRKP